MRMIKPSKELVTSVSSRTIKNRNSSRCLNCKLIKMRTIYTFTSVLLLSLSSLLLQVNHPTIRETEATSAWPVLAEFSQPHLSRYDEQVQSSSLGEPVFRLEPPAVASYSNTRGLVLPCLASGLPRPQISWLTVVQSASSIDDPSGSSGASAGSLSLTELAQPVTNVTGLRQISSGGRFLRLLPFKRRDFQPEIHATEYRCTATNQHGTIHSRSVQVQPAFALEPGAPGAQSTQAAAPATGLEIKVNDEFVQLNGLAVFRCKPVLVSGAANNQQSQAAASGSLSAFASSLGLSPLGHAPASQQAAAPASQPDLWQLVEWFTSDGLSIAPGDWLLQHHQQARHFPASSTNSPTNYNKFTAFASGELHLERVELRDLHRTYGCRMRYKPSGEIVSSSGQAQLIAPDQALAETHAGLAGAAGANKRSGQVGQAAAARPNSGPVSVQILHSANQLLAPDYRHHSTTQANSMMGNFEPAQVNKQNEQFNSKQFQAASKSAPQINQQLNSPAPSTRLLVIPCAIRLSEDGSAARLRWYFRSSGTIQPASEMQPLEDWALRNSISMIQLAGGGGPSSPINQQQQQQQFNPGAASSGSRIYQGRTFLALEGGGSAQSGRYSARLAPPPSTESPSMDSNPNEKTLCDIDVILFEPLQLRLVQHHASNLITNDNLAHSGAAMPLVSDKAELNRHSWLNNWLPEWAQIFAKKQSPPNFASSQEPVSMRQQAADLNQAAGADLQGNFIKVSGPGKIPAPTVIRVGQMLQLDCLSSGFPLDEIRWFRNGHQINTQSSQDFQIEIATSSSSPISSNHRQLGHQAQSFNLISSLIVRQVQPKEAGLQMFECFAFNNLGDRARASIPVLILDGHPAQSCPVVLANNTIQVPDDFDSNNSDKTRSADYNTQGGESGSAGDASPWGSDNSGEWAWSSSRAINLVPSHALVLESESVELMCPLTGPELSAFNAHQMMENNNDNNNNNNLHQHRRIDWRRLSSAQQDNQIEQQETIGAKTSHQISQQLFFTADSRFLANGSTLLIRSPTKRHDEGVYACRARNSMDGGGPNGAADDIIQADGGGSSIVVAGGVENSKLVGARPTGAGHQSSSGPSLALDSMAGQQRYCSALLGAALFGTSPSSSSAAPPPSSSTSAPISSISIKIIAKPKIDPFEFSHSLEEGMRAVAVCSVISGQSPVDITWFKNGQILAADEQVSIEQASGFTSTITFHKIRSSHSGFYTCIASNAFGSSNHSSRLIVNVAPYFVEPPRSTSAILNSQVMVNCRAGGQPSPQIRWRKLAPSSNQQTANHVSSSSSSTININNNNNIKMAPSNVGMAKEVSTSNDVLLTDSPKYTDFRIITSNSHIQVLENGSMIIKEVEHADATRYVCQAFNGINPSLSEMIELKVQNPAQFEVNYEAITVKRDALIKFSCAPKGDQPIELEWFKGSSQLLPIGNDIDSLQASTGSASSKYSEVLQFVDHRQGTQHRTLIVAQQKQKNDMGSTAAGDNGANNQLMSGSKNIKSSELVINFADRTDTGNFVCRAKNQFGRDELTYRLVVQESPDPPLNLVASNIQPHNVRLIWTLPFDGNSPISHHIVEYRRINNSPFQMQQPSSQQAQLSLGADGQQSSPSLEWQRLLVATSNKLQTIETMHPSSGVANSSIVTISPMIVGTSGSANLIVHQLTPRANYQFRVAALNGIGQSAFSSSIQVQTAEEAPSQRVANLRIQPISSSAMKLVWRAPMNLEDASPIRGYYISYRKHNMLDNSIMQNSLLDQASSNSLMNADGNSKKLSANNNSNSNNWLATVSINAMNATNFAAGPNYETNSPQMPLSSGSGSPGVSGPAASVLLAASSRDGVAFPGAIYEYLVTGLERNCKYEIRVQPFNSMGVGPAAELVGQTLKFDRPGQPNLRLVKRGRQSFELSWTISDSEPLGGFSLFYKNEYEDWAEIPLALVYSYVIENLRCGNKYQIYLTAFNLVGRSEPSDVLSARTEGSAPIAPDKSRFIKSVNMSEVQLDMSSWKSGGCPISSFSISYKRHHDSKIVPIPMDSNNNLASNNSFTLSDLAPATWYKLIVTAYNEAGPTAAEFVFSTLTLEGETISLPNPIDAHESSFATGGELSPNFGPFGGIHRWLYSASSPATQNSFGWNQADQSGQVDLFLPASCLLLLLLSVMVTYFFYSKSTSSSTCSSSTSSGSSSSQSASNRNLNHKGGGSKGNNLKSLHGGNSNSLARHPIMVNSNHGQHQSKTLTNLNGDFNGFNSGNNQFCQADSCNGFGNLQQIDEQHELLESSSSHPSAGSSAGVYGQQQQQATSQGINFWAANSLANSNAVDSILVDSSPSNLTAITGFNGNSNNDDAIRSSSFMNAATNQHQSYQQHFATLHHKNNSDLNNTNNNYTRTLQLIGARNHQQSRPCGFNSATANYLIDGSQSTTSTSAGGACSTIISQDSGQGPSISGKTMLHLFDEQPNDFLYSGDINVPSLNIASMQDNDANCNQSMQQQQQQALKNTSALFEQPVPQMFSMSNNDGQNQQHAQIIGNQQDHRFAIGAPYASGTMPTKLISSASFMSTAELMQRQQQPTQLQLFHESEEPIYQRLDKLHEICSLRQAGHSQTLRLNYHGHQNQHD